MGLHFAPGPPAIQENLPFQGRSAPIATFEASQALTAVPMSTWSTR